MVVEDLLRVDGIGAYKGKEVVIGPNCHDPGCRGYGVIEDGICFIGIAPGRDEVRSGRPLTGPSGQLLNAVMEAMGLERNKTYCTNLICWWKDDPSKEEAERCAHRLDQELKLIKPKLIVLLGSIVAEIFTKRKFGKVRGAVQWNETYNCYVMATYHPAGILRSMGDYGSGKDDKASIMIYDFVRDLRKIPQVLKWNVSAPEAKIDYEVVDNAARAQAILFGLTNLPTNEPVALDVETTYNKDDEEVEIFENDLLCVGVGTAKHSWVFTPEALYTKDNKPALVWPDLCWTMHNASFDTQVMKRKLDVWINVKEDTMLQSYSLDERQGVHRLKTLAREYLAAGFYEDDRFYGKMRLDEIPRPMLYEYNARDVAYTARLCKKFRIWQEEENVRGIYDRILIPAVNMYKELSFYGVNIDKDLHKQLAIDWIRKKMNMEIELQQMVEEEGWDGVLNFNSGDQLGTFLFRVLSLPIIKRTPNGKPSVDKEVLEKLRDQHPFVHKIVEYRKLVKMISSYVVNLHRTLKDDGRAHPKVKLHASQTGRPSFTDPALQTFPVPFTNEEEFQEYTRMRELIIATQTTDDDNDPYVLIEADYGKAEIWMAYAYSGDPQMYADLTSGDYHTNTGVDVLEKPFDEVTKQDRVDMKRVTFGIMYYIEANSLGKAIKKSSELAQRYINRWMGRNHVYRKWFFKTIETIMETGELVTKSGRKRRVILLGDTNASRIAKQAVNFPIQSTSNDVVLDAAIELHPKLKKLGGHLLFTVHDSILGEIRQSKVEEAVALFHEVMTKVRFEGVPPIPVEIKIGKSWGTTKEVHDCARPENKMLGGMCLWKNK